MCRQSGGIFTDFPAVHQFQRPKATRVHIPSALRVRRLPHTETAEYAEVRPLYGGLTPQQHEVLRLLEKRTSSLQSLDFKIFMNMCNEPILNRLPLSELVNLP